MTIFLSAEQQKKRIEICVRCEKCAGVKIMICKECGCPLKSKVALTRSTCPQNKWPL